MFLHIFAHCLGFSRSQRNVSWMSEFVDHRVESSKEFPMSSARRQVYDTLQLLITGKSVVFAENSAQCMKSSPLRFNRDFEKISFHL
ncbi:hypothetical protein Leryth_009975 [Lithospermum erythrorhizon]|nr:hypothetical protein Leryth_009975 [Lithospermum erythrorhizon]